MRRVTVFGVTPGMRLARSIRGSKGEMLLAAGMNLSETHLRILRDRGVFLLDVEDGLTDDIEIEETIPEDLRQRGVKAVQNVHTLLAQAAETMDSSTEESLRSSLQTASFARSTKDQSTVHALADAAIAIVDNILNSEAVLGLSSIRLYDQYTFQHSVSTAVAGVVIGRNLGWQRQQLCDLATGCLMHDIGKIFIDREVLNKPGRLTEDETRIVQEHAKLGYETVRQIFGPGMLSNHVPYQHHERQDGTGYPRGLCGDNHIPNPWLRTGPDQILAMAQVASVADVYDALNSDRPYRPAVAPDQLIKLLNDMSGTYLNQALVERFLAIISPFPTGSEVVLRGNADVNGCKGVVVRVNPRAHNQPVVRVLFDPYGGQLVPFELDLTKCPDLRLESTVILPPGALSPLRGDEGERMLATANARAKLELASPSIC